MKNIIIGTAGHIDHGKTTLIKAITGRNTDRLKEEQKRGISIDLGFTYFDLPSGRRAGIIDVPGHEKFIKNMLAGVIGIDIVILVIAADEGVMPQTKEHLDILNLLGIKNGIVALTKIDLVEEEWRELVVEEIKENLKGTFLENSPIIQVSSVNRVGIDEIVNTIDKMTDKVPDRDITLVPRLPIDRVFTLAGFGTIVTGTLISGTFSLGDEVQIFPGNKKSRIRSIQVHGKNEKQAYAGQRVAINLPDVKKEEISRGNVLAPIDSMQPTMMIDVKLDLLQSCEKIIEDRTRLRLYIGTNEVLFRIVLLDKENLSAGESCYAQLRLEDKIVAKPGDRFIIRSYSPMVTIGGGKVLESNPPKRKKYDQQVINELRIKESGNISDIIEEIIKNRSSEYPTIKDISTYTVLPEDKVNSIVKTLECDCKVVTVKLLNDKYIIHKTYYDFLENNIRNELIKYHKNYPLRVGMPKEEIKSKYFPNIKPKLAESIINIMIDKKIIKQTLENVSIKEFEVKFNSFQLEIRKNIEDMFFSNSFNPPKKEEIIGGLTYDVKDINQVFEALVEMGIIIKINDEIYFHNEVYKKIQKLIINYIENNGSITVAQGRDLLKTSRKIMIALMEYMDKNKITKRIGNERILFNKKED